MERAIEVRYGRTREWDEGIVKTYYWTGRPDMQGEHVLDVEKFLQLLDYYYELRGWDKATGIPTRQKLEELGLKDVADELERMGKLPG
ncbi:hypothetical protein J7K07_05635 [Candidatus Bathyarchaeota archaeon]|nr:hypothetical protein [Candidatus Bathyarchaeota archaeon]